MRRCAAREILSVDEGLLVSLLWKINCIEGRGSTALATFSSCRAVATGFTAMPVSRLWSRAELSVDCARKGEGKGGSYLPSFFSVCAPRTFVSFALFFLSGESSESWGFGGTAKKSFSRRFENYGQPYGLGDVIGTIIDLDHLKLSYTKNGVFLGTAYDLPPRVRDSGIFPHLYLKNVDVQVNFKSDSQWFAPPNPKIQFVGDVLEKVRRKSSRGRDRRRVCR